MSSREGVVRDDRQFSMVVSGTETWLPMREARASLVDPELSAEIGGYVLRATGSAREILRDELAALTLEQALEED